MANWYLSDSGRQAMGGQVSSTSALTTVTASATLNAVGTPVQMIASTPFPASGMLVFTGNGPIFTSAQNSQTLLDVLIGASAQEQPLVSDFAIGGMAQFVTHHFPLSVPAGSRLALRLRSAVASKAAPFGMMIYGGGYGLESGQRAVTYGAVTASSRGTVLNTPTLANTKSAWIVISTSTTAPMRWLVVGLAAPNTATSSAANGLVDIGVGAAGLESVIVADIPFRTSTAEDILAAFPMAYPVNLPAGVRLVARVQTSVVAAAAVPNLTITGIY